MAGKKILRRKSFFEERRKSLFAKKEKLRKQGEKQEYMEHIEALKQEDMLDNMEDDELQDSISSPSKSALMQRLRLGAEERGVSPEQARLNQQFKDEYD